MIKYFTNISSAFLMNQLSEMLKYFWVFLLKLNEKIRTKNKETYIPK